MDVCMYVCIWLQTWLYICWGIVTDMGFFNILIIGCVGLASILKHELHGSVLFWQ